MAGLCVNMAATVGLMAPGVGKQQTLKSKDENEKQVTGNLSAMNPKETQN
jgi:hypothetical protein